MKSERKKRIINKLRSAMYRAGFKNIRLVGNSLIGKVSKWYAPINLLDYLDRNYISLGGYGSHSGNPVYIRYRGKSEDITYKSINDKVKKLIIWFKV